MAGAAEGRGVLGALTVAVVSGQTATKVQGAGQQQDQGESVLTVLVAGLANLGIAVAKGVGALVSGSSAMLSEATHSLADTVRGAALRRHPAG